MSGFYDSPLKLGLAAKAFGRDLESHDVKGVYWTLNPIDRSTLKFVDNDLRIRPKFATGARNILNRSWLLIDADPVRPSGTNATDEEKAASWSLLQTVAGFLTSIGWPEPLICDSGNGYHALYRVSLPSTDSTTAREVLRVLAWKFDTDAAKVDQSVFDAPRICKVPGTWVRKGPHSAERPHRMSRIILVPKVITQVTGAQLVSIIHYAPPQPAMASTPAHHDSYARRSVRQTCSPPSLRSGRVDRDKYVLKCNQLD